MCNEKDRSIDMVKHDQKNEIEIRVFCQKTSKDARGMISCQHRNSENMQC